jgi:MFS family permease
MQVASIPFFIKQEWTHQSYKHFDKIGSVIYSVSLFCLVFGFSDLPNMEGVATLAFGVFGLFIFYYYEKRITGPIYQVRLFGRNRDFTLASLAAFLSYAATMAVSFMVSLYLLLVRGFDTRVAGFVMISSAVVQSFAAFYSGRLADKFEPSKIAAIGMGLNAIGLLGLVFIGPESSIAAIVAMLLFLGLGFGLFCSPNTKVIMGSVEQKWMTQASATVGTMRLTGQAFSMGIAVMAISLFMGSSQITPENFEGFMQSWKFTFILCSIMCITGTCACAINKKSTTNH